MNTDTKILAKSLVKLTIPAVIEYSLQSAANYADYLMVGNLGEAASATIGVTSSVNGMLKGTLTALSIGIVSHISIEQGKGNNSKTKNVTVQVLFLSFICGILMLLLAQAISPFLPGWMGAELSLRASASQYFSLMNLGILGTTFNMMFCACLRGTGNMKTPMYVNVGMNILNIMMNFIFIYPDRIIHLFGKEIRMRGLGMDVNGAALATAIATTIGGIVIVTVTFRNPVLTLLNDHRRIDKSLLHLDKTILRRIFIVAFPAFLCRLCSSFGRVVFTSFVTGMGTTTFAAHTIAMTAESAFFMPAMGASSAATTLAGNAKGENSITKLNNLVKVSCVMIFFTMSFFSVLMFLFAENIMQLFSNEEVVILLGTRLFYIVALNEPFFGISVVMEGIFNGTGYTKETFKITVTVLWTVRVLGTWVCIHVFGMGVYGAWLCMILDNTIRAVILFVYYQVKIKRIVIPCGQSC